MINEKLEKLNQEIAKGEARLRRAQHEEKMSRVFDILLLDF